MPEPEDIKAEDTPEPEDIEVVAHSDGEEEIDPVCYINNSSV